MGWHRCRCHRCRPRHRFLAGVSRCRHRSLGIDTGGNPPNLAETRRGLAQTAKYFKSLELKFLREKKVLKKVIKYAAKTWERYNLVIPQSEFASFACRTLKIDQNRGKFIHFGNFSGVKCGVMTPVSWHRYWHHPWHRLWHQKSSRNQWIFPYFDQF